MSAPIIIHVGAMVCKIEGQPPGFEIDDACSYHNASIAKWLNQDKPELIGNELLAWLYSIPKSKQAQIRELFAKAPEDTDYWEFLKKQKSSQGYAGLGGWGGGNFDMNPERAAQDEITQQQIRDNRLAGEVYKVATVVHLYDIANKTFPFGLLPVVENVLKSNGFEYTVVEDPDIKPSQLTNIEWIWDDANQTEREYQAELREIAKIERYGMFSVATGGGKSRSIANLIFDKKVKTLILVNSEELMYQLYDFVTQHIKNTDPGTPGLVGDGQNVVKDITIAIVNSAYKHIEKLAEHEFDMVIVDEGHHAASKTYFVVLKKLHPYYCYALTGTAFRTTKSEEIALKASFKRVVQEISFSYLVKRGFLVPATLDVIECQQKTDPTLLWHQLHDAAIVQSSHRNLLIAKKIQSFVEAGNRILVTVDHIEHGRNIAKSLASIGVACYHQVYGNTSKSERRAALPKLIDGSIKVLIGTVYNEGVNIPNLDVVVNAAGKRAKIRTFQRVGRALRKVDGKTMATVVDVWDAGHRYLEEHSKDRISHYIQAGVQVSDTYLKRLVNKTEVADIKHIRIDAKEVKMMKDAEILARAGKQAAIRRKVRTRRN